MSTHRDQINYFVMRLHVPVRTVCQCADSSQKKNLIERLIKNN